MIKKNQTITNEKRWEILRRFLSTEILSQIKNKAVENVVRKVIFEHSNVIDWDKVYDIIIEEMPELRKERRLPPL